MLYWFDEIHLKNSHTQEASLELVERVRHHKPGLIIAGDATSKAGQRAAAGKSDYDILCGILDDAGIKWSNETPDSNPAIIDRVNTFNTRLKDATGTHKMWFHPLRCKHTVKDCERVVWKSNGTLDQTTDPERTHHTDGCGYAACALTPLTRVGDVGRMVIIPRW